MDCDGLRSGMARRTHADSNTPLQIDAPHPNHTMRALQPSRRAQNGAEPWPRHVDNSTENSTGTRQLLDSYSQLATRQDTRQVPVLVPVLARQDSLQCTRFYRWFWTRLQKLCTGSFAVAALSDAKRQCKLHVPYTNRSLSNFVDRTRQLVYRYSTGYGTGTGYFMYCMMPYRYGW